jgi:hypothetical protein
MAHITALSIMVDMWGLIAIYNWDLFMNSGPFGGILYSSEGIARVISFGITGVTTNIYIYIAIPTKRCRTATSISINYSLGFSMTEVSQWQDDGVNLHLTPFLDLFEPP